MLPGSLRSRRPQVIFVNYIFPANQPNVCLLQALLGVYSAFRRESRVSVTSRPFGGWYRSRTCDSQILNLVLYPLS